MLRKTFVSELSLTDLEFGSALRVGAIGEAAAVRLRASGSYKRPWQHSTHSL